MDQVVQQAAANSEETSSAAEELAAQASGLAAMIGQFQLERAVSAPVQPILAAPAPKKLPAPKAKGSNGNASTIHLRPEDVIPLESEVEFKDF